MREDMRHVLTDRPRSGGKYSKRARTHKDLEGGPTSVSMRGLYMDRKAFNDHVRPLERFLRGCVGRPWDKVYEEIRARVSPSSTMEMHLLEHVGFAVEVSVEMVGKIPYRVADRNPLYSSGRYRRLYVHPRTGILCLAPMEKKAEKEKEVTLIVDPRNPRLQYRKIRKIAGKGKGAEWVEYWIALTLVPRPVPKVREKLTMDRTASYYSLGEIERDAFFKNDLGWVSTSDSKFYYGDANLYCASIRPVTSAELKMIRKTLES